MRLKRVFVEEDDSDAVTRTCALYIALLGGLYSIFAIMFVIYQETNALAQSE